MISCTRVYLSELTESDYEKIPSKFTFYGFLCGKTQVGALDCLVMCLVQIFSAKIAKPGRMCMTACVPVEWETQVID